MSSFVKIQPLTKKIEFEKRRFYRVIDNSYQECLSDGCNHYLAGMHGQIGQTVEIIGNPWVEVRLFGSNFYQLKFIHGKCQKGLIHKILYHN